MVEKNLINQQNDRENKELGVKSLGDSQAIMSLAWCYAAKQRISSYDIKNDKQNEHCYSRKNQGNQSNTTAWNMIMEVPNTSMVILNKTANKFTDFSLYDVSQRGIKEIYCSEIIEQVWDHSRIQHGRYVCDMSYNSRRNLLAIFPIQSKVSYHLYEIRNTGSKISDTEAALIRRSKWHDKFNDTVSSLNFDFEGRLIAEFDAGGVLLISQVEKNLYVHHQQIGNLVGRNRCRWSSESANPILYCLYDRNKLNIIDAEKQQPVLDTPFSLQKIPTNTINWIDVCSTDSCLLATCGFETEIKIYDRRQNQIIRTIGDETNKIRSGYFHCVRWSPSGETIALASHNNPTKLVDFGTGKTISSIAVSADSICFI